MALFFQSARFFRAMLLVPAMLTALLPRPAAAAPVDFNRFSDAERAGLAFAKLSNTTPDFPSWVRETDEWKHASVDDQPDIVAGRSVLLRKGYDAFDPASDLIHVTVPVQVRWNPTMTGPENAGDQQAITLILPKPAGVFSYKLGDMVIDVMVSQLDEATILPLPTQDYDAFVQAMGTGNHDNAILELNLLVTRLDVQKPGLEDGKPVWPMLGKIAHLTLWDQSHQRTLWAYDTPDGHDSAAAAELDGLYNR